MTIGPCFSSIVHAEHHTTELCFSRQMEYVIMLYGGFMFMLSLGDAVGPVRLVAPKCPTPSCCKISAVGVILIVGDLFQYSIKAALQDSDWQQSNSIMHGCLCSLAKSAATQKEQCIRYAHSLTAGRGSVSNRIMIPEHQAERLDILFTPVRIF